MFSTKQGSFILLDWTLFTSVLNLKASLFRDRVDQFCLIHLTPPLFLFTRWGYLGQKNEFIDNFVIQEKSHQGQKWIPIWTISYHLRYQRIQPYSKTIQKKDKRISDQGGNNEQLLSFIQGYPSEMENAILLVKKTLEVVTSEKKLLTQEKNPKKSRRNSPIVSLTSS